MYAIATTREERGREIASNEGQITRINDYTYKVSSQSKEKSFYDVKDAEIGWTCSCPDHKHRGAKCKHIWAVQLHWNKTASKKESRIRAFNHNALSNVSIYQH